MTEAGFDERDVSDTTSFVLTLTDIGLITRTQGREIVSLMKLPDPVLPQAVTQACASFVVRNRESSIPEHSRVGYITRSAHIQHNRLKGEQ